MTEKECEELRKLYFQRAKKEISEGSLDNAFRAFQMVQRMERERKVTGGGPAAD